MSIDCSTGLLIACLIHFAGKEEMLLPTSENKWKVGDVKPKKTIWKMQTAKDSYYALCQKVCARSHT